MKAPWYEGRDRVVHPHRGTGTRVVFSGAYWGIEWDSAPGEQVNYMTQERGAPYDSYLRVIGR